MGGKPLAPMLLVGLSPYGDIASCIELFKLPNIGGIRYKYTTSYQIINSKHGYNGVAIYHEVFQLLNQQNRKHTGE